MSHIITEICELQGKRVEDQNFWLFSIRGFTDRTDLGSRAVTCTTMHAKSLLIFSIAESAVALIQNWSS